MLSFPYFHRFVHIHRFQQPSPKHTQSSPQRRPDDVFPRLKLQPQESITAATRRTLRKTYSQQSIEAQWQRGKECLNLANERDRDREREIERERESEGERREEKRLKKVEKEEEEG